MKKLWNLVGVFITVVVLSGGVKALLKWRDMNESDTRPPIHMRVNDSTQAELARLRVEKDSLDALVDAAKTMHGTAVAGLKIVVPPETVYVTTKEVVTVAGADSSRTATVSDSLKNGMRLSISAEAPKYPGPLKIGYTLTTPEFAPEIGFVKRPEGYFATVSWAGQKFTVKDAFFTPPKERPLTVFVGADLYVNPSDNVAGVRPGGALYGGLGYQITERTSLRLLAGNNGSPFVGLSAVKRIW